MLEQCLETLDHQNFVLNGQAEELALLRAKLRTFETFMDTIKQSQGRGDLVYQTNPINRIFQEVINRVQLHQSIQGLPMVVSYVLVILCKFPHHHYCIRIPSL